MSLAWPSVIRNRKGRPSACRRACGSWWSVHLGNAPAPAPWPPSYEAHRVNGSGEGLVTFERSRDRPRGYRDRYEDLTGHSLR